MGRRVLAFFLGFLLGIIFIVGAVAGAIYVAVCVVKTEKIIPNAETYLGDLSHLSAYDIYQEIYRLYGEKKGLTDENGNYFTLEQFCDNYHIDLKTALNMDLPREVLDLPAFEVFNEGGMDSVMKQIKVSTLPAVINMFGKNEDGSGGAFGENVIAELGKFSMHDLFSQEVGFVGVFANVRFAEIVPSAFPDKDSDNKMMWALGQTKIGGLISGVSGSNNITLQLKEGGAFEELGKLELTSVVGESRYVNAIIGENAVFADLIADDGSVRFDEIIDGVSMGEVIGCQRNEIADITGHVEIALPANENESVRVMVRGEGENAVYVKSLDETWYEAKFTCEETDEAHVHHVDCYGYAWYSLTARENGAVETTDLFKDGNYYPQTVGLYGVLANLSVKDLTSGNDNALMDKIKHLTVRDILNQNSQPSGVMAALIDLTIDELMHGAIDELYLGSFFNYYRKGIAHVEEQFGEETAVIYAASNAEKIKFYLKENAEGAIALSSDDKQWYAGQIICDTDEENHEHNGDCYGYIWYQDEILETLATGIQGKFANKQIANLTNLNEEVKKLTLHDVMGDSLPKMFKDIGDTTVGNIESGINKLYLGSAMSYHRKDITDTETYGSVVSTSDTIEVRSATVINENGEEVTVYIKTDDGKSWYEAALECYNNADDHTEHTVDCYKYLWYTEAGDPVTGVAKAFVNSKMNNVGSTMNTLTIRQLGINTDGNVILGSIQDVEIMHIGEHINGMKMGSVMGYFEGEAVEPEKCGKDHQPHLPAECDHYWYEDAEKTIEVKGLNYKIANKTIKEMTGKGLTSIAVSLTIGDLIDSKMMKMGDTEEQIEENEYKFDIIFDGSDDQNKCSIQGYIQYCATENMLGRTPTAKGYYQSVHGLDQTHRGQWRKMELAQFISRLLGAF